MSTHACALLGNCLQGRQAGWRRRRRGIRSRFIDKLYKRYSNSLSGSASRRFFVRNDKRRRRRRRGGGGGGGSERGKSLIKAQHCHFRIGRALQPHCPASLFCFEELCRGLQLLTQLFVRNFFVVLLLCHKGGADPFMRHSFFILLHIEKPFQSVFDVCLRRLPPHMPQPTAALSGFGGCAFLLGQALLLG